LVLQSANVYPIRKCFVTTEEENAAKVGFIIKQELFKVLEVMSVIILSAADLEACFTSNPF
jgi:hypothetical protein